MKKLYISVAIFFLVCVFAFVYSFVYLDRYSHRTYYYYINREGRDIGTIKIDRFLTEEKLIYKSASDIPFLQGYTKSRTRLTLNRKYVIESYLREDYDSGISELVYLENNKSLVNYLSRFRSGFTFLENMAIKKETYVFGENSPVTYFPIIENYDFRRGRSQGFNAISLVRPGLPPISVFVTLTSVKDEYIKIESRKIKAEKLLLKIKGYPQAAIWVAKSDRCLIRLEIPKEGIRITRSFNPKVVTAGSGPTPASEYTSKEVSFKSKTVELAGTMTFPQKEGRAPAILLVWGRGPHDRRYQGLFSSMSDHLTKIGYCVLSFDRRGVGSSKGDGASAAYDDEVGDISAAIDYLASQEKVDPQKIAVIAHSEGAFYAARAASGSGKVGALVLMDPLLYPAIERDETQGCLKDLASAYKWNNLYLKRIARAMRDSKEKAMKSRHNWSYIMGRRCFLKNLKEDLSNDPFAVIKSMAVPILILRGEEGEDIPSNHIFLLEKALRESGKSDYTIKTYTNMGHFFGKLVNDGVNRMRYTADNEMMENISGWLGKNLIPRQAVMPPDGA